MLQSYSLYAWHNTWAEQKDPSLSRTLDNFIFNQADYYIFLYAIALAYGPIWARLTPAGWKHIKGMSSYATEVGIVR